MDSGELIRYLKEHLDLGYPLDELKLHLASYGLPTKTINKAVSVVKEDALSSMPAPPLPQDWSSTAHVWLLMPAVFFVFIFGVLLLAGLLGA